MHYPSCFFKSILHSVILWVTFSNSFRVHSANLSIVFGTVLKRQDIKHQRAAFTNLRKTWSENVYFNIWGMLSDSKDVVKIGFAKRINFGRHYFCGFWPVLGSDFRSPRGEKIASLAFPFGSHFGSQQKSRRGPKTILKIISIYLRQKQKSAEAEGLQGHTLGKRSAGAGSTQQPCYLKHE